jgi:acetyl-CoA carboxylase biotin carboxyl carrier protein
VNLKEIKEMINLMNDNNLLELEVEKEGMRIRLKKMGAQAGDFSGPVIIERQMQDRDARQETAQAQLSRAQAAKAIEVKAPMVGTLYRAPSPGAPSYVEIGQTIEPGQVICIIEAMKLMNEIKAEIKGKILEILVENAEPVEFGQPMFLIESF